jgi:hypothetical protein
LEFCGFDARRIFFSWNSTAEAGVHWVSLIDKGVRQIAEAGPFPAMHPEEVNG